MYDKMNSLNNNAENRNENKKKILAAYYFGIN